MMKFNGAGLVWDNARNKVLCRLPIETEDNYIIGRLSEMGYKAENASEEKPVDSNTQKELKPEIGAESGATHGLEERTNKELITQLIEMGVEIPKKATKAVLIDLIVKNQ